MTVHLRMLGGEGWRGWLQLSEEQQFTKGEEEQVIFKDE